jgi:hypothetical protein
MKTIIWGGGMKAKISSLGIRNKRLMILGVVFLVIGFVSTYYQFTQLDGQAPFMSNGISYYPYGNVSIILLTAGIAFTALGFLLPSQRTQQQRILSLGTRNLGLVVFGVVSLIIGLVTSYYQVLQLSGPPSNLLMYWEIVYPYRNEGIISLTVGTILIALGLLFPLQKTQQPRNILTFNAEMDDSLY